MRIGSFLLLWTWRHDKLREVTGVRRSRVDGSSEELVKRYRCRFQAFEALLPLNKALDHRKININIEQVHTRQDVLKPFKFLGIGSS